MEYLCQDEQIRNSPVGLISTTSVQLSVNLQLALATLVVNR